MNEKKALGKSLDMILKDNFIENIKGLKFSNNNERFIIKRKIKIKKIRLL